MRPPPPKEREGFMTEAVVRPVNVDLGKTNNGRLESEQIVDVGSTCGQVMTKGITILINTPNVRGSRRLERNTPGEMGLNILKECAVGEVRGDIVIGMGECRWLTLLAMICRVARQTNDFCRPTPEKVQGVLALMGSPTTGSVDG
jgi:hypothetical protein